MTLSTVRELSAVLDSMGARASVVQVESAMSEQYPDGVLK